MPYTQQEEPSLALKMMKKMKEHYAIINVRTSACKRGDKIRWPGPGVVIDQVNQQVFVKYGSFNIRIHPLISQLVKLSSQSSIKPVNEQSSQHNYNHQNENNTQIQQAEIDNSSDSESECSYTSETPPQNEDIIHIE